MDGLWSSPDLAGLLAARRPEPRGARAVRRLVPRPGAARGGRSRTGRGATRRAGSRRNIAAHYDLGNDFYRLFLDETMTYSSAVFETPDQSLADAQRNKYRRIADGAGLRAGPARPRDRHRLGRLRAVRGRRARLPGDVDHDLAASSTTSPASASAPPGSSDLVDVQLRDYRDVEGTYDAIVSIEMLEAVGAEYLATFFEACDRGAAARRPAQPPGRSPSRTPPTSASSAARTGSRRTSSRAACARRSRSSSGRPRDTRLLDPRA